MSITPEAICGGCNSSYSAFALDFPYLYYACGPVLLLHNLSTHITEFALQGHKGKINCVCLLPPHILTGGSDNQTILWTNRQKLLSLPQPSSSIFISAHSDFFAIISSIGIINIYNSSDFSLFQSLDFSRCLQETCALSSLQDTFVLATSGVDSKIHLYLKTKGEFEYSVSLEGHLRNIRSLSFKKDDGLWLASAGQDCYIRLWRIASDIKETISGQGLYTLGGFKCKLDAIISGHSNLISSVSWVDNFLLTASHDFTVMLWQEDSRTSTWTAKASFGQLGGNKNIFMGALGGHQRILAYTYSGGFYQWVENEGTWTPELAPTGHFGEIMDIAVCAEYVLTCGLDQTCRLWTFHNNYWLESSRPMIHGYDINSLALWRTQLVSGADEKIIRVFDPSASTAEILSTQGIHIEASSRGSSQVLGLTTKSTSESEFDFKSSQITEGLLSSYTLWPETNKLYGHGYEINVICSDHNGRLIASACKAQNKEHSHIFLWDFTQKTKVQSLEFHSLGVTDMSFSHNDGYLLSVSRDRSWCLFESDGNSFVFKVSKQLHSRVIYTCCWSPSDSLFATGSRDKKLKIWNPEGENLKVVAFQSPITASCFVSEEWVVCGLENGDVLLTNIENQQRILVCQHGDSVKKIRHLSGKIYSVSADHTLRINIACLAN